MDRWPLLIDSVTKKVNLVSEAADGLVASGWHGVFDLVLEEKLTVRLHWRGNVNALRDEALSCVPECCSYCDDIVRYLQVSRMGG